MSRFTSVRREPRPEDYTNVRCRGPFCDMWVQNQYYDKGIMLCQDHALDVWIKVQELVDREVLAVVAYEHLHPPAEEDTCGPAETRSDSIGVVYYLRIGEHVKIGFTTDLDSRMKSYPPDAEVLAVHGGTYKDEQDIHRSLAPSRAHRREWYRLTRQVENAIDHGRHLAELERARLNQIEESRAVWTSKSGDLPRRRSRPGSMYSPNPNDPFHKLPPVIP